MRCPLEGFPIYCIYLFIYPFIYPFIYLFISRGSGSALVSTPPSPAPCAAGGLFAYPCRLPEEEKTPQNLLRFCSVELLKAGAEGWSDQPQPSIHPSRYFSFWLTLQRC